MAGGINNPKMVAQQTNGILNANFFIFPELHPTQLETQPIWILRPQVLTFHFGIPQKYVLTREKSLGIQKGITATNIEEAIAIEEANADFIVAQGIEAGGHRGCFHPDNFDRKKSISELLYDLIPKNLIPIVAAGGIMTGNDAKQMLQQGARAVQMGTAFITTHESTASAVHKRYLLEHSRTITTRRISTENDKETVYTKHFSGRAAQGIYNNFIKLMENKTYLPFPIQNLLTNKIRKKAIEDDNGEYQSLWCGSGFKKCKNVSVSELIATIENDLKS
eukprot:gene2695-5307_t